MHIQLPCATILWGQAIAGCIGGKKALTFKNGILDLGDGAFLMHGMEIATAQQYKNTIYGHFR